MYSNIVFTSVPLTESRTSVSLTDTNKTDCAGANLRLRRGEKREMVAEICYSALLLLSTLQHSFLGVGCSICTKGIDGGGG